MELKEYFDSEIVPCIRADGGWLELVSTDGNQAVVKARGECTRCIAQDRCLRWAESRILEGLKREIHITAVPEPFLWRK